MSTVLRALAGSMKPTHLLVAALASFGGFRVDAQDSMAAHAHAMPDSDFHAMQERGKMVMGVDQYTSTHHFEVLPSGGRIELQRNSADDTAGIRRIRAHLAGITHAFESGDFSAPGVVHMQAVPGTRVMAANRRSITYTMHELPRGGEIVIATSDPAAIRAIHEFLAFQRGEHRAD